MIFGKHINKYYWKYGWMLLLGVFALLIVDFGQLEIPEYYRMVVNGMNSGVVEVDGALLPFDMTFLLDRICRPMIFIVLLIVIGRFLWRVCFFGAAIKVETDLRDSMFDHCRKLSQQYYQVNKVGDLMSLFTNDLETVQDCYGNGVLSFFDALVLGGMAFIKMLTMDPTLTALSLIPLAIMFLIASKVGHVMNEKWKIRQEAFSSLSDFSQESFSGIAVIKAFAKELKELLAFRQLNKENEDVNVDYVKVSTLLNVLITLFVESIICVILGFGGYLVYKGTFNAGQLVEFIGYFTSIIWPVMAISMLIEMHAKGSASLTRISELLDADIDVLDRMITEMDPPVEGGIRFDHLTFAYPSTERPVLKDLTFEIKPGERIGILGRTGSGKTTLVDLITRIYNVKDGTLFIDGYDVNRIPIEKLRSHIAYVPQDNFLFSDTIKNNIAFSLMEDPGMAAVETAAIAADIHGNISEFPEKYETLLGERGVTVSGGQKQRISIARALMKDSKILILDDSVSAVDTKTERSILNSLRELSGNRTLLLIAHRISTIRQMDRILFLDNGELVDFGTHEELLERCPLYVDMVNRQQLEEEKNKEGL